MNDQNDEGAESRDSTNQSSEIIPSAEIKDPQITTILIPPTNPPKPKKAGWIRRHWKLTTITVGGLVALAAILTIPNSLMDLPIKWRELSKPATTPTTNALFLTNVLQITNQDFIEGTKYTRARLEEFFPFGYRIIFYKDGILSRDHGPSDHLEWDIDWQTTKISPDFSSRKVQWLVRFVTIAAKTNDLLPTIRNMTMVTPAELIVGNAYPLSAIAVANEPEPFGMVIGDNQRAPVFVIGFRIHSPKNNP